jgi:hypothetical protein
LHRKRIKNIADNAKALISLCVLLRGAGLTIPAVPPGLLLAGVVLVAVVGLVATVRWIATRP